MDPVAQAPSRFVARDRDRAHDLADLAPPAEQVAARGHPAPDMIRVAVELERARVDDRSFRPVDGLLGGHDVEQVDPPGRALDDLEAAVAARSTLVLDDRPDLDAHDLHEPMVAGADPCPGDAREYSSGHDTGRSADDHRD